jgi:hypothetical protein
LAFLLIQVLGAPSISTANVELADGQDGALSAPEGIYTSTEVMKPYHVWKSIKREKQEV